jgi:regulation of enolase protein 1 (concanavalin A-like superfamily)
MTDQRWDDGRWTVEPAVTVRDGDDLLVTAVEGSDAWRETAYGYVTDNAHGLLAPMENGQAIEVSFVADFDQQFDQAGLMLRGGETQWIKAGVEYADGVLQLGAVVTRETSDWSSGPVEWAGREVTMSASRLGNAVMVRARTEDEPYRLIRLAWVDPALTLTAGPYLCAPTNAELTVRFTGWRLLPPEETIHADGLPDF